MKEIKVYVGKEIYKVDLDNLLSMEVETVDKINYSTAKRYNMLIDAIEVTIEDCTGTPVNIVDEHSYKLAIAELINLIIKEKEDNIMVVNGNTTATNLNEKEETIMRDWNAPEVEIINEVEVIDMKERIVNQDGSFNHEGVKEVIAEIGETISETLDNARDDIEPEVENIKGAFAALSGVFEILGLTKLKSDYDKIMCAGLDENGNFTKLKAASDEMTALAKKELKRLSYFSTNKTIAQSIALKTMIGEGENKNIFEALAATVMNVVKRVASKIAKLYNIAEEKAKGVAIKAILKGIKGIFSALLQGAKIVIKLGFRVISFVIAGGIAIGYWVFNTIKKLFTWIKNKVSKGDFDEFEDDFDEFEEVELELDEDGNMVLS